MTTLNENEWRAQRDADLEQITENAESLLVDRTVVHVQAVAHDPNSDCTNVVRLTLDDGSVVDITGGYGGYSGRSCDEYVELISVDRVPS